MNWGVILVENPMFVIGSRHVAQLELKDDEGKGATSKEFVNP